MAQIFCVLLSFLILSTNVEGSYAQEPTGKIKIAFNNPGFEHKGFWKNVTDVMQSAAKNLNMELDVWYGDRNAKKMRKNAHAIYTSDKKYDYVILVNEHQQGTGFLRMAEEKKTKTLFLLNTVLDSRLKSIGLPGESFKYWLGSITPDNAKAGKEMALSLIEFAESKDWKPPYRLLTISGDNKTPASLYRNSGLNLVIEDSKKLDQVGRAHALWSEDNAEKITLSYLHLLDNPPQLIWAANDNIAKGAVTAMASKGLKAGKDYGIAGLNWSKDGVEAVHKKQFTMTHGGHFFGGAWALIMLYDIHNGHAMVEKDSHIRFPMTAITSQNVEEYSAKLGSQDWDQIDFKQFSKKLNPAVKAYDFSLPKILQAIK